MKIVQINSVCGVGSTGRITVEISKRLNDQCIENYILYGVGKSNYPYADKFGGKLNIKSHQLGTRLLGKHGFYSKLATQQLIKKLVEINPDIIHLHNLHGHYLNIEILFNYLAESNKKVVWTLHDCWSFTGHCSHFDYISCDRWKTECHNCPQLKEYPKSLIFDRTTEAYFDKKKLFTSISNMIIITPSQWLANLVKQSFLGKYKIQVINNGIDLEVFKPTCSDFRERNDLNDKFIILGVASYWNERKGLLYFIDLSKQLGDNYKVILVGLNLRQMNTMPSNILGIKNTNNLKELVELYSVADVFLNPTLEDTFPTVNLEALACGTPIITFNTGGSAEAVDSKSGIIVESKTCSSLIKAVKNIKEKNFSSENCINRAKAFSKADRYQEYIQIYRTM